MPPPTKPKPREAVTLGVNIGPVTNAISFPPEARMTLTLFDFQQVTITLNPENAKQNPAPLDGVPQWSTSNPAVATVTPAADGLSALVKAVTPGATQVIPVGDADMSAGVRELSEVIDIDVKPGEAVTLGATAGEPENQ